MKTIFVFSALVFSLACGQGQGQDNQLERSVPAVSPTPPTENVKMADTECKTCDFDFATYKGDLKKEEVDGLLLALNDEYMAWATYDQINKDFKNPRPFSNIQQAEARHAERLKEVFAIYKLPVPENKWTGNAPKFANIAAACKAGVEAEIANRDLYTRLFKSTVREDILVVYRALQKASEENHLPAFQRCGQGRNGQGRPF